MSRFVLTAQLQLQAPNNVQAVVRQLQQQLQGLTVNVNVQGSAQAQRQLQQVTQQTNAATSAADRMGRAFALSVRRFAAFSVANRAVGLLTSSLSNAVDEAIKFERQLIKVAQVTGKNISELKGLTREITSLATNFGVVSSDLLNVSTVLSQAGLTAQDTTVALRTLAKAALAPNFDSISETAEGAIAILAQFQEGVGALEKQLGSINAVAGAFAVEAGDLIDVIRRTGGVFKASGGSLNELLALFTSVRATTRESAESIGTGLRTIFTRIQRPKTIEYLKQFGVELVDLNGKFVGPFEAVKRLSAALAGLGEGDVTFIRIAEELGGFRQIGKVLPLLQQFSTAQQALNVAQNAGNSLTDDAAKAQLALAVRITKVKEEFLALVRGITETTTFQVMANTALTLASALIKIGEAIKPLLPLLAAVAAVRFTQGIGSFIGGALRGATSGRPYSTGGKVHHFARGGMVPGTGNRDTVPAMLQPGEFVIRKSSVAKIGADNLAGMNKYADGGQIKIKPGAIGGFFLQPEQGIDRPYKVNDTIQITGTNALSKLGLIDANDPTVRQSALEAATKAEQEEILYGPKNKSRPSLSKKISSQKSPANPNKNVLNTNGTFAKQTGLAADPKADARLTKRIKSGSIKVPKDSKLAKNVSIVGDVSSYFPGNDDMKKNSSVANIISSAVSQGLENAVLNSAPQIASEFTNSAIKTSNTGFKNAAKAIANDANAKKTTEGFVFEGAIQAITGAKLSGGQSNFDFAADTIRRNRSSLAAMFTNSSGEGIDSLIKADAKRSNTTDAFKSIINKISNDINKGNTLGVQLQKFAAGGGVGTDTVPALLTPGEFVVNKKSAQAIGYGSLNRMNKVGKYAKGGVVQRFAKGGGATKADVGATSLVGFDLGDKVLKQYLSGAQRATNAFTAAMNKVTLGLTGLLTNALPATQRNLNFSSNVIDKFNKTLPGLGDAIVQNGLANKRSYISQEDLIDAIDNTATNISQSGGDLQAYLRQVKSDLEANTAQITGKQGSTSSPPPPPNSSSSSTSASSRSQSGSRSTSSNASASSNTKAVNQNTAAVNRNAKSQNEAANASNMNALGALTMASSIASSFLPALDESSSGLVQLSHKALGLVTTIASVGFALEAFGLKLNKQSLVDFFSGKKIPGGGGISKVFNQLTGKMGNFGRVLRAATQASARGRDGLAAGARAAGRAGYAGRGANIASRLGNQLGQIAKIAPKVLGGFAAIVGSAFLVTEAFNSIITTFYDYDKQLKKAIEKGNVEEAEKVAGKKAALEGANYARAGGATVGAGIGFVLGGPIGAAIGAALGAGLTTLITSAISGIFGEAGDEFLAGIAVLFGGNTYESTKALAAAQAGAVKTQKALDEAQKTSVQTMEDFRNGTISATDALTKITASTLGVVSQQSKRVSRSVISNLGNRSEFNGLIGANGFNENFDALSTIKNFGTSGFLGLLGGDAAVRNTLALGGLNPFMETAGQRNDRLSAENVKQIEEFSKQQQQAFDTGSESRVAAFRSAAARGGDVEAVKTKATEDIRAQQQEMLKIASAASKRGDTDTADAATAEAEKLRRQLEQVNKEAENVVKEVARQKALFNAMNLGLRSATATATAMSASLERVAGGFEVGGSQLENDLAFLETALSSAAQAMNPDDIKSAVGTVSNTLREFGTSEQYIKKFEGNIAAFTQAQQNYTKAFDNIKNSIAAEDFKGLSPVAFQERLADELANGLGPDVSDEAKENLRNVVKGLKLDENELNAIIGGDLSVLGDKLSEAQKKQIEDIQKIAAERQKAEQILIDFTKKRIEAERSYIEAQQQAIDLIMEGREIQGKYGGAPVTNAERTNALLTRSNVQSSRLGLTDLRTGDAGELRNRNQEIRMGFGAIEARRRAEGGMSGRSGVVADEMSRDLQKAQQEQVSTIRSLIKIQEDELKIIQEKNKLEKSSLESLIKGDVEAFFKQQSAVGAQAAIASGDARLQSFYGAEALGTAFEDLKRQQEAGVQSVFGQRLSGAGGLLERGATAALGSRGVTDLRSAQVLAGSTPEEEAAKARLRELGGVLGETGQLGADMASMQVQTAEIQVQTAEIKFNEILNRGNQAGQESKAIEERVAMSKGGVVYANRGIFVPRGTDTVPAMLTPGEFVVNRAAVQRGNNLQLLKAMNNSNSSVSSSAGAALMSRGGQVQYLAGGGWLGTVTSGISGAIGGGLDNIFGKLTDALTTFSKNFSSTVESLSKMQITVKLDSTNVNVNLNNVQFLYTVQESIKNGVLEEIRKELNQHSTNSDGKLAKNTGVLNRSIGIG